MTCSFTSLCVLASLGVLQIAMREPSERHASPFAASIFATQVDCVICSPARRAASIRQMPRGHVVEFTEPAIDHRTPVFRQNVAAETDSSEVSSERSRKAPLCVKKVSRQTSGRVESRFGKGKKRTSSSRGLPIAKKGRSSRNERDRASSFPRRTPPMRREQGKEVVEVVHK